MQVQYRNCNYIGGFNSQLYQRNGYGLAILDNSNIIMAKWKTDAINGPFVMITERLRVLGTMINNKLEGYNVISMQQSLTSNKKQKERTIYGMFRDNKLYGKALVINDDQVIIAQYTNGQLREISDKKPIHQKQVYDMLQICFPNETYTTADWLTHIFSQATREYNGDGNTKYEPVYRRYEQDLHFYGFVEIFNKDKGIGFLMHQGEVISIGQHDKDFLEGLGRAYHSDGTVEDGIFKQGELHGIGIRYNKTNHKYVLGEHGNSNDSFETGFGFPQKQINEIRKQFHLRSINFYNDIVFFPFATIFEAICANCLNLKADVQSPRFSSISNNFFGQDQRKRGLSEKSPLRAKILQYQHESDQIDEPSPIKNKPIHQYEKTDLRKNKYFVDEQQEIRYDKSQLGQKSTQYKVNSRSRSKTQKVDGTSPLRRQAAVSKGKYSTSKIRDTKELVRELDEKQRTRRGYLDQIYKQAKLYSRRN